MQSEKGRKLPGLHQRGNKCSLTCVIEFPLFCVQVEVPLGMAKKLILLSADKYDTSFSISQYVSPVTMIYPFSCTPYIFSADEASVSAESG